MNADLSLESESVNDQMDRAMNNPSVLGTSYKVPGFSKRSIDKNVFQVPDPPCPKCSREIDFSIFENFENTGTDWVQWRCKEGCGFFKNVEIL